MPDVPDQAAPPPPIALPPNTRQSASGHGSLATVLSLFLALFLIDAALSLADDTLILATGIHLLGPFRFLADMLAILTALVVYVMMGLTPLVPKRFFLPLALFYLFAELILLLPLIYFFGRIQTFRWGVSILQVVLGLAVFVWVLGGFKARWPLVGEDQLQGRTFSWLNLCAFLSGNLCLLLPAVLIYVGVCTAAAVDHFSSGFVRLRPNGISMQVRKYVRDDGKTIQLYPMSHIADDVFYRKVEKSFPTNAIVLLEGVSDEKHLLTNKISYKKIAENLGLSEQHEDFKPARGRNVRADVDIDQFSPATIQVLNFVMDIHDEGVDSATAQKISQFNPTPDLPRQLYDDLLAMRNRHLLAEIQTNLTQTDCVIVPWGAAHMPGLAREIEKSGFRVAETTNYMAIRFRYLGHAELMSKDKQ